MARCNRRADVLVEEFELLADHLGRAVFPAPDQIEGKEAQELLQLLVVPVPRVFAKA